MFRYNELDCKPGYVESDHLSRSYVAIKLKRPTWNAAGNCIIPQVPLGNHIWSCFGWGLQSLLCYHSSGELLPRLSTLTAAEAAAVYFCCTFPRVASGGRYPLSCPAQPGLSSQKGLSARSARLLTLLTPFIILKTAILSIFH